MAPKKKKKKKLKKPSSTANKELPGNFVPGTVPGCYIAHYRADWLVDYQPFDAAEFGLNDAAEEANMIPDISVDPETKLLTVINLSHENVTAFFITVENKVYNENNEMFIMGHSTDKNGHTVQCITFILVLKPRTMMDIAYLDVKSLDELRLESDVQVVTSSENSANTFNSKMVFQFPLRLDAKSVEQDAFLCSQGSCGHLSHFFRETLHAVDICAPIGTPVVAIGSGEVINVQQSHTASGIHIRNLFTWNSIMLKLDVGAFVEYVHIRANSALVKVGDRVEAGQQLCESGQVGFCPVPHLHMQVHESKEDKAPTIPFAFQSNISSQEGANHYFPIAGQLYNTQGPIVKHSKG